MKLYQWMDVETSEGLQSKVFVDYMLYFCNWGRENLQDMKQSDFKVGEDSRGEMYVYLSQDKHTKKPQG